jgi:hypothetical protein
VHATTLGAEWRLNGFPPDAVETLWRTLMKASTISVDAFPDGPTSWKTALIQLLCISDEASANVGFQSGFQSDKVYSIDSFLRYEHLKLMRQRAKKRVSQKPILEGLPHSICDRVPSTEVCVQPKTNTPVVGCTLRSMSKHLALLPSRKSVATSWLYGTTSRSESNDPFNILLIPFPYFIEGSCFVASEGSPAISDGMGFFDIDMRWLRHGFRKVARREIADFISTMIEHAKLEVGEIHAVVMPEASLNWGDTDTIADQLGKRWSELELFVTGVLSQAGTQARNLAITYTYDKGNRVWCWGQSKHHRWCLEESQVRRYHLGHALNPATRWWEKIDVSNRSCVFLVARAGASLSVLVCEDLARFDPVQPAILSVGPNLVIALLMDGPQLEHRWPGRYATALADDPGSSILTLTCLGMVRRSSMPGIEEARHISLWKEPGGVAKALNLPKGDHGMVLTLTVSEGRHGAMDGRHSVEGEVSSQFNLSGVHSVRLPEEKIPPWVAFDSSKAITVTHSKARKTKSKTARSALQVDRQIAKIQSYPSISTKLLTSFELALKNADPEVHRKVKRTSLMLTTGRKPKGAELK